MSFDPPQSYMSLHLQRQQQLQRQATAQMPVAADQLPSSGGPMLPFTSVLPIRGPLRIDAQEDCKRLQHLIRQLQWKENQVRTMIGAGTYDNFCRHRVIDVVKPMESAVARWPDVPAYVPSTQNEQHCPGQVAGGQSTMRPHSVHSPISPLQANQGQCSPTTQSTGHQDHGSPAFAPGAVSSNTLGSQGSSPQSNGHRLQDYAMQLMLLERQNRRRLELSKQEWVKRNERVFGSKQEEVSDQAAGKETVPKSDSPTLPSTLHSFKAENPDGQNHPSPKTTAGVPECKYLQEQNTMMEQQGRQRQAPRQDFGQSQEAETHSSRAQLAELCQMRWAQSVLRPGLQQPDFQQPLSGSDSLKRPSQNVELLVDRAKRLRLGRRRQSQMMAFGASCRCPSDGDKYSEATYAPRESFSIAQNLEDGAISEASWVVALDAFEAATISLQTVLRKDTPDTVMRAMDSTHLKLLMLLCQMMVRALNKNDLPVKVLTAMRCLPTSLRFGCDNRATGETLYSRLTAHPQYQNLPGAELAALKSCRSALDAAPSVVEWGLQNLHSSFNNLLYATNGPEYYALLGGVEAHLQSLRSVVENFVTQSISCNKVLHRLLEILEQLRSTACAPPASGGDGMGQGFGESGAVDAVTVTRSAANATDASAGGKASVSVPASAPVPVHIDAVSEASSQGSEESSRSSYSYSDSEDEGYTMISPV